MPIVYNITFSTVYIELTNFNIYLVYKAYYLFLECILSLQIFLRPQKSYKLT